MQLFSDINHLCFDFDGTLVKVKTYKEDETIRGLIQKKLDRRTSDIYSSEEEIDCSSDFEYVRQNVKKDFRSAALEVLLENNLFMVGRGIETVENLRFALSELNSIPNLTLSVHSARDQASLKIALDNLDIAHYFKFILGANSHEPSKPNKYQLENAISKHSLRVNTTLYIGDSIWDYELSKNVKCQFAQALWFENSFFKEDSNRYFQFGDLVSDIFDSRVEKSSI